MFGMYIYVHTWDDNDYMVRDGGGDTTDEDDDDDDELLNSPV